MQILEATAAIPHLPYTAAMVANELTRNLSDELSATATALYTTLVHVAIETSRRRGESTNTCEVVFHLPLEQLAKVVGVSRVSAWRHLPALKELGLIDYRTHKASCRGEVRNSGTVWRVRLTPRRGCRARVSADDLRHKWRDMDRDVRSGRTSYKALKHTSSLKSEPLKIESLLAWTLPPHRSKTPFTLVCFNRDRVDLESLLDVTGAAKEDRGAVVDSAARALAAAMRDATSLDWYRKLLWQLLRRYNATGEDHSYSVYLMSQRARVDVVEDFARKGGAVLVSRLKGAAWWDEVMRAPPVRVGVRPLKA